MISSKRRAKRNDNAAAQSSGGKGAKRRRIHEPTKIAHDSEPMDIDPTVKNPNTSIVRAVARSVQATAKSSSAAPSATKMTIPSAFAAVVSDTSPPMVNRYVPKAPPTVEHVLDGLRRPKSAAKKKKSKQKAAVARPPKPPSSPSPPSVATPRLQNKKSTTKKPTTRPSIPQKRQFIYRAVTFVWFAVMIKLTVGFLQPSPSLEAVLNQIWSIPSFLMYANTPTARIYSHIKPPKHVNGKEPHHEVLSNMTLRDFVSQEFHLALAPAFFGIYAYTGIFMAWNDTDYLNNIQSVVGSSAGAMAAVILAAGIEPHKVAELGKSMTLEKFADPPAFGGLFKGDKFERIMEDFIQAERPNCTMLMEDSEIPVAVTVFDLKRMKGRTLTTGSMAKAARSSATFPLLFQPVLHEDGILIDGGVTDMLGLKGLAAFNPNEQKRVVNIAVGGFLSAPPGPKSMPEGVKANQVLSVSILNTPQCGPWAMLNGPRAIEAARLAMEASLDLKLYHGKEEGHYELHVDALTFVE